LTNSADFEHFSKCFWDVLPPDKKAEFDDVLHLLPTRLSVLNFNCRRLASAQPVLQCHAKHNHKDAKNGNQMMQKNYKEVLFAEGPKVMLTCNLWTSKGLVNEAQCVVKKIWFDEGSNACSHLPAVVQSDAYSGPETPAWEGIGPSWVPIVPAVAQWEDNSQHTARCYILSPSSIGSFVSSVFVFILQF
jgi:hypothetical protein